MAQPFLLNVASALCQFAGACAAPLVVDRIGRRPLAIYGISLLALIDFAAGGLAFHTSASNSASSSEGEGGVVSGKKVATSIAALSFLFNFVWTASFYAISLLTPSEYPAAELRTATMSYAIFNGQTTAVVTTFVVPQLTSADALGLGAKAYLIFGAICVLIVGLAFVFMPETKGRTTREIEALYRAKVPKWKWNKTDARLASSSSTTALRPSITNSSAATVSTATANGLGVRQRNPARDRAQEQVEEDHVSVEMTSEH